MFLRYSLIVMALAATAAADVRVWEGVLTLPTHEEGTPDSNPPFDQFSTTHFSYPYTLRENLTDHRADHNWRAVFLENEYLKCTVLPDIGGHLYTCLDKLSGQSMFYANPSIKKARIGYRGAWAAFGIEFNFPVSHNWVSMSPVVFEYAKNSDGSASVRVGNVDRVYGMEWTVEMTLRPASTLLEQRVTLNNRSDVRHRFYWWSNAGVEVKNDDHVVYPMRFSASHGFVDVDTWPVDSSGIDMSVIRNQTKGPVSRFVHGSREPFMGIWHPDTRTGVVHYADYGNLPAKKIWSWGVDADGLDWRKQLSDNNSGYVEVQGGLFRNQETYAFLEPRQTIRFTELWMPVRDTGGFVRATPAGVLNLSRGADALKVEFVPNRAFPGATIRITDGARVLVEQKADLGPEHVWKKDVSPAPAGHPTVEIRDAAGAVLMRHTEGVYDWTPAEEIKTGPQTAYVPPPPAKRTEGDWAEVGKDDELNGRLLMAMDAYVSGLATFPHSFALQKSAGRLAAALLRYDEAVQYLEAVAARDTWDPEIAYYLGLAYDGLGRTRAAGIAFENAARMPSFHVAGTLRLAELTARQGDREKALALLRGIHGDLRVVEEIVALGGKATKPEGAISPLLQYEAAPTDAKLLHFLAADPDRVLNIAATYMRLGLYPRALSVLSIEYPKVPADQTEPGALLPQQHPIVALYRAYCREKIGESAKKDDDLAETLSTQYVFPGGASTLEVLRAAVRRNPQSAVANYMLGTQSFAIGLTDAALSAWEQARRANSRLPVLHASIGRVMLNIRHDPASALAAYQEGLSADPANVEVYAGMDQSLTLLDRPAAERVAALERYPDKSGMPAELVYKLIMDLSEAGQHERAIALFQGRFFARQEGGTNVRQVWVEVRTQQALGLSKSGQCDAAKAIVRGLGEPVNGLDFTKEGMDPFVRSARTQYLLGKIESQCGAGDEAKKHFERAAAAKAPIDIVWAHRAARELPDYNASQWHNRLTAMLEGHVRSAYATALLQLELGRTAEARTHLKETVLLPDRMLALHLTRLALDETATH